MIPAQQSSHPPGADRGHRCGLAWVTLTLALAVHVADEAAFGFLSFYNPIAEATRAKVPFLAFPTFTLEVWLSLLILAVTVLLLVSPAVFRLQRWTVPLSYIFAIVMLGNGLLHIVGSLFLSRPVPGVYSSPLLLLSAAFLLSATHSRHRPKLIAAL